MMETKQGRRGKQGNQIMNKTLALLTSAAVAAAAGSLAISSGANARVVRHFALQSFYGYAPQRFYESPTYAPDRPALRGYNNPGIADFQDGSRG
jgi:hypothetical protein